MAYELKKFVFQRQLLIQDQYRQQNQTQPTVLKVHQLMMESMMMMKLTMIKHGEPLSFITSYIKPTTSTTIMKSSMKPKSVVVCKFSLKRTRVS